MAAAAPQGGTPGEPAINFLLSGANGQLDPETLLALAAIEIPQPVRDAFEQLADAAGLPEGCVDGVADAIELILNGVIALPLELADALTGLLELLAGLGGEGAPEIPGVTDLIEFLEGLPGRGGAIEETPLEETPLEETPLEETPLADDATAVTSTETEAEATPPATEEEVLAEGEMELPTVVQGLIALGAALQACIPTPPAEESEPETPPVSDPTQQPPAPEAQPVAAPVAYLGYAPTGAETARADDTSVPLTALGGGLVLVAAGAAGYGMRGRAVRTRD